MTHRCHNREFLLKSARDRDGYRARLREHLPRLLPCGPRRVPRTDSRLRPVEVLQVLPNEERLPFPECCHSTPYRTNTVSTQVPAIVLLLMLSPVASCV